MGPSTERKDISVNSDHVLLEQHYLDAYELEYNIRRVALGPAPTSNFDSSSITGENNPQFGKKKSPTTLAKLIKLVYVYNSEDMSLIGAYPTVECFKNFNIGKDTLSNYLRSGLPYKGKIYTRTKLHK